MGASGERRAIFKYVARAEIGDQAGKAAQTTADLEIVFSSNTDIKIKDAAEIRSLKQLTNRNIPMKMASAREFLIGL